MRIVTSFGEEGYNLYGKKFIESWRKWGEPLTVYVESDIDEKDVEIKDLFKVPYVYDYLEALKENGLTKAPWTHNLFKFCRKALIICNEPLPFFWIDADTVIDEKPPESYLEDLLGDYPIAYMPRDNYHPCTSLIGFNDTEETRDFQDLLRDYYLSGEVLALPEWHDAYVFGHVVNKSGIRAKRLTDGLKDKGPVSNVFNQVFKYGHHNKGNLKFKEAS